MTARSDDVKSWAASIGLHALLFLFMIVWVAFPDIPVQEVIELTFLRPSPPLSTELPSAQRVTAEQAPVQAASVQKERTQAVSRPASVPSPSPRTTARTQAPVKAAPSTSVPVQQRALRTRENPLEMSDFGGGKQESSSAPEMGDAVRQQSRERGLSTTATPGQGATGAGESSDTKITSDPGIISATPGSSYNITWASGLARNRIAGSLPGFPPGDKRDVQVSVRFQVRPDGTLYGMTVMQKGDPRYEDEALRAVRSWRFNALTSDMRQADQVGSVTFTFKVR